MNTRRLRLSPVLWRVPVLAGLLCPAGAFADGPVHIDQVGGEATVAGAESPPPEAADPAAPPRTALEAIAAFTNGLVAGGGPLGTGGPTVAPTGNTASVEQIGDANWAALTQDGARNRMSLVQRGDGNTATLTQQGNENTMAVEQIGDGLSMSYTQIGDGLSTADLGLGPTIVQMGTGLQPVIITQHQGGGP